MPGFLLHIGATVLCAHGGQAVPTAVSPRVTVMGQPIVTLPHIYSIAGCPFTTGGSPLPCITAQWTTGATRITSDGMPVLLMDSQAVCTPNATPLIVTLTQTRVTGI
jgi:hypothetical protein